MTSVDGLASGLDTTAIIRQLMQIERMPQMRLKEQQNQVDRTIKAYQNVNAAFLAFQTAADALTTGTAWTSSKAMTSDATRATATAAAGAPVGTLTFSIEKLAKAGSAASTGTVTAKTDQVAAADSVIRLGKGTTYTDITLGTGTLDDVVTKINEAKAGVTASAVEVSPGQFKLSLTSTTTGSATNITIDDGAGGNPFAASTLGSVAATVTGQDAEIYVGDPGAGYTVTRSTNTVTDLMDGVTINLAKAEAGVAVTVAVEADPEATADAMSKLVETANAALAKIKEYTTVDMETGTGALMTGDGVLRSLQQRILATVNVAGSDNSVHGVSLTRDGTIAFDKEKFLASNTADPVKLKADLGAGFAERLRVLGDMTTRSDTSAAGPGTLTAAIEAREDTSRGYTSRIDAWDARLELRESGLRKKFAALEVALNSNQQQMAWLQGQLATLPRYGD